MDAAGNTENCEVKKSNNIKPKVVVGMSSENFLSKMQTDFVVAQAFSDSQHKLVIDLGECVTFNLLQFNADVLFGNQSWPIHISVSNVQNFPVGTDPDTVDWQLSHEFFRRLQRIYVPKTTTKLLRIQGMPKLNSFKVEKVADVPELVDGVIYPTENIFTPETAEITRETSQSVISWNFVVKGLQTPYTKSEERKIVIYINQPYYLRRCRFRL